MQIYDYDIVAANNDGAPPNGFPEFMAYAEVNDAMREVMASIARWRVASQAGTISSAGGTTAYTFTSGQGLTAYAAGQVFTFTANATSTGNVTLNVDGLGARNVTDQAIVQLNARKLLSGRRYTVLYDGTQFRVIMGDLGGPVTIQSGNITSGTTLDITGIPAIYSSLLFTAQSISHNDAGNRQPILQPSSDNGSTWDTTATNYVLLGVTSAAAAFATVGTVASFLTSVDSAAAETFNVSCQIEQYQASSGGGKPFRSRVHRGTAATHHIGSGHTFFNQSINALRLAWNGAGSFDGAGTYSLFGIAG